MRRFEPRKARKEEEEIVVWFVVGNYFMIKKRYFKARPGKKAVEGKGNNKK